MYKETIFDAYEKYGYVIDYIDPDKNETGSPMARSSNTLPTR